MLKRAVIFMSIMVVLVSPTIAQNVVITGVVSDTTGTPVIGATIVDVNSKKGAISGESGFYKLEVPNANSAIIEATYVGYETTRITANGRTRINIVLSSTSTDIDEIMVVGYGSSSRKELTGANVKLKGKELEKLNVPRMDQALQGQISGVTISTNSGSPGGASSIRIRGLSTFGDNDPLILVDGVVYDSEGLNALNPNDIASINVLKDATAGIYGVRAANGVILIETKKGQKNTAPTIELSAYAGIQTPAKKLNLLNATEYAVLKNEMFANGNDDQPFSNTQLGEGTNWQDSVFQPAWVTNYNVGITGGAAKTTYSLGASYYSQDGIVGGDKANFTRMNARVNLGTELSDRLSLNSIFLYTNEERDVLPENGIGSVLYNAINAFPTDPIRDEFGNYTYLEEVSDIINPIAQMENTYNTANVDKFVGKEELAFDINDNLTFTNRFNYNFALVDVKVFSPLVYYGPGKAQNTALNADLDPTQVEIAPGTFIDRGASVYEERSTYSDINYESFINHKLLLKNSQIIKTTLGISVFRRMNQGLGATAYNIPNNSIDYADISANLAPGGYLNNANSFQYEERLLSAFVRSEYNYRGRYVASIIIRRDGSSKFGPNNRFGTFPTVSGSWVMSDEDFFTSERVSFLKVRASYGITGNDQIDNFAYRALLNGEGVYVFDDVLVTGVAIGRASNPDLKWETTRQTNLGVDLTLLRDIDISTNFFIKNTRDLLFQPEVSGLMGTAGPGGSNPVINAGDVSNMGVELELGYDRKVGKKSALTVNFNATSIRNQVVKTPEGLDFLPGASFGVGGNIATRFQEGFPIGYYFGYVTDGVFQNQSEIDNAPTQSGAKPGDLRYKDLNGDGVISFSDNSDQTMIGSPIPKATFGLALTFNYSNFDLSSNFYAAVGQDIIRNYERQQPYANMLTYNIDRWIGPGSNDVNPRLTTDRTRNGEFSDYFVEEGSFLRMKNVQLGYTLPADVLKGVKVRSARIYLSANNLVTLTKYQGFDPDIGSAGGTLSSGVDYGFYPQARSILGGLTIRF